jgi:hypothetical protein
MWIEPDGRVDFVYRLNSTLETDRSSWLSFFHFSSDITKQMKRLLNCLQTFPNQSHNLFECSNSSLWLIPRYWVSSRDRVSGENPGIVTLFRGKAMSQKISDRMKGRLVRRPAARSPNALTLYHLYVLRCITLYLSANHYFVLSHYRLKAKHPVRNSSGLT